MTHEKRRILLVDDEPDMIMIAEKRLAIAGFDVMVASDGQDGLDKAHQWAPDLIVLDVMLPKINGYQVCTMLRRERQFQHVPIVMLSAKAYERDKQEGMSCGADVYITKPYNGELLLEQIRALLKD